MNTRDEVAVYESPVRFHESRIRAAAVYCSDGRFGEHVDDFLHNALKLPRYDRLAVPGGAACLAGHFLAFREEEGLIEQLRFLIKVHGLERVVLVAHQDCAFYTERLHVSPLKIETQQQEDMQTSRSASPLVLIRSTGGRILCAEMFGWHNSLRVTVASQKSKTPTSHDFFGR